MYEEIQRLRDQAHQERVGTKTLALLNDALRICDRAVREGKVGAYLQRACVLGEMAREERTSGQRAARWAAALRAAEQACASMDAEAVEKYASLAVDCCQDSLSSLSLHEKLGAARSAANKLKLAISLAPEPNAATLFACRSSVLRQLALYDVSSVTRQKRLIESHHCAEKGYSLIANKATALEFGLSTWSLARFEPSDQKYTEQLTKAEDLLGSEIALSAEVGRLALAQFYRSNFRPADACRAFEGVLAAPVQTRRVLRNAYVYAEAAIQVWYAAYPEEIGTKYLKDAKMLLETAIAAGYRNARMLTDLAFAAAIVDGVPQARVVLQDICDEGKIDWSEAIRVALKSDDADNLTRGFAIGMDESGVWTRLGTFALSFLEDNEFAEMLYRAAIRINSHDAVALTNLARFLCDKDDDASLIEAEKLVSKAASFADRRFVWWRSVQHAVALKRGHVMVAKSPARPLALPSPPIKNLSQIRQRFRSIEALSDRQRRGYELETLVYELAKLTFGVAEAPYRVKRGVDNVAEQIDGFFRCAGEKYRVECKWENRSMNKSDVVEFEARVDVTGVSGLLLSMGGFEDSAKERARFIAGERAILLMDGDEARAAFHGDLRFDEMISIKRAHLDQRSDPYFVVTAERGARAA